VDEAAKWDRQHALARQALLNCLPKSELTNVYKMKLASEIWSRLAQEHGAISIARRAIANRNFYQLIKGPSTSVDAYIPVFTKYLQDLNYNLEVPLKDDEVNIAFLASLGPSWQTFQQSMGERVNTLKPAMLYAEVRAFEMQKGTAEEPDEKVAYALHRVQKGRVGKGSQNSHGKGHSPAGSEKWSCNYCKKKGHLVADCYKLLWKKQTAGFKEDDSGTKEQSQSQGQVQGRFGGWVSTS